MGDSGAIYEEWMDTYGPVFQVPIAMGSRRTVLCDPKAIAHFYAREVTVYVKPGFTKNAVENLVIKLTIHLIRYTDQCIGRKGNPLGRWR